MVARRAGAFVLPEPEVVEALYPPVVNWNTNRLPVVSLRRQLWVVKAIDPAAQQREVFAYSLAKGMMLNVAEVRRLGPREIAHLQRLDVLSAGASAMNVVLSRLAQTYPVSELPQRTLNAAAAGELVFSLWIRRRDATVWNRTYLEGGIPVFFDFNASLGFEPKLRSAERFFARSTPGHGGAWRVRERTAEPLDSATLRLAENHHIFVDDIDGFVREVRVMRERISATSIDIRRLLGKAGYSPIDIDELEDYLRDTGSSLEADAETMLEVVLQ